MFFFFLSYHSNPPVFPSSHIFSSPCPWTGPAWRLQWWRPVETRIKVSILHAPASSHCKAASLHGPFVPHGRACFNVLAQKRIIWKLLSARCDRRVLHSNRSLVSWCSCVFTSFWMMLETIDLRTVAPSAAIPPGVVCKHVKNKRWPRAEYTAQ